MVSKYCLDQKGLLLPNTGTTYSANCGFYDIALFKANVLDGHVQFWGDSVTRGVTLSLKLVFSKEVTNLNMIITFR